MSKFTKSNGDKRLETIKEKMDDLNKGHLLIEEDDEDSIKGNNYQIIGRTRYSDEELEEFRTLINEKLNDAREELKFYQDAMKERELNDDDIKFTGMEDGGHTNEKEQLNNMANRQIKFIQNLENALIRIENKTYGICRQTGELIDKKRLMAVPHATLSMAAKDPKFAKQIEDAKK